MKILRFLVLLPLLTTGAFAQKKTNATELQVGTVPDAQLSNNVLLKSAAYSVHTTSTSNSSGAPNTVITVTSARHIEFLTVSCAFAGTRQIQISTANAVAGGILYLRLSLTFVTAAANLVLESGTSSPTVLTTYTTGSGVASGVWVLCFDGTAWKLLFPVFPAS